MSSTDCNSSIASSTTTTSLGSKSSKKRLSGIKKFKSKLMRRKSNGATDHHLTASQSTSGEGCNSELRLDQIPQDLPTVMDVNVSMETAADENELSSLANYVNNDSENSEYHDHDDCSYCPYKSKSITHGRLAVDPRSN